MPPRDVTLRTALEALVDAADRLVDDEPCRFDHHGGCQTHGFLEPEPDDPFPCGMAETRIMLDLACAALEADR